MTTEERLPGLERREGLLLALTEQIVQILQGHEEQMAELRRDGQQLQRLWVHLAKKHGWLDDEDLASSSSQ